MNEAAILAALKRLEPNANAIGARYDHMAIPQDSNDKSVLKVRAAFLAKKGLCDNE